MSETEEERRRLLQREQAARASAEAAAATLSKLERVTEIALRHLSLGDLLHALLERVVEVLEADIAAILLLDENGALAVRSAVGLSLEHARAVPVGEGMAGRVAVTRAPLLVPDLSKIELVSPVLRERGVNSLVAIPLIVEVIDRIAFAVNQASLHEAERAAQERLQFLGEVSALLGSSLDVDTTLRRVAQLAVPHFADWCAVDLLRDDGAIERFAFAHADPAKLELASRIVPHFPVRLDDERGVGSVIRSGSPALNPAVDADQLRVAYGDRRDYLELLLALDLRSTISVPLEARDRMLGALTLGWAESGRSYGPDDLSFAEELASRAAVAVD